MKKTITYNKFIRKVILLSTLSTIILFILYGNFIQSNSIEKSIKADTNIMAKLIFQNLYTVMKAGGDKELLDGTIKKIESDIPHININIIKENDNKNEIVNTAFKTKEMQILNQNKTLQFVTPILFKQECLHCHSKAQVDDVAGVILIDHSILDIKISLKEIISMVIILFLLIILVFFTTWIYFLKKYFIEPINNLIHEISSHKTYKDLKSNIVIDTNIREIKLLEKAFNTKNKALYASTNKLEKASNKDHLTGIYNRKKFNEYSTLLLNDAQRYNHTFCVVLIDLNKFKPINDTYGHSIGDKVLIFFTQVIKKSNDEAKIIVQKLQDKFKTIKFIEGNINLNISASYGIAQYGIDGKKIEELIKIADTRMYENKKDRR